VISVGGLDENDARWTNDTSQQEPPACSGNVNAGSNYGPTVDIYAAAHNIHFAVLGSTPSTTTSTGVISGTSFSAPLVAGLIARFQESNGTLSPAAAWTALQNSSLLPSSAIEPYPASNNKKIARLSGQASCSTEYP
jgi:Subtilase family